MRTRTPSFCAIVATAIVPRHAQEVHSDAAAAGPDAHFRYGRYDNVQIASCEWDPSFAGKRLSQATVARGLEPTVENAADTVLWMTEQGECLAIFHAIDEADLQRILKKENRHPE